MKNMETINGMLKCPCCGAFVTNTWEEKDALRRRLNREYKKQKIDNQMGGRKRIFGPKKYKTPT
jgi:hypothetical protein